MKIVLVILVLLAGAAIFFATRKKKAANVTKEIAYGPFVIRAEGITGKTFNANYGMVNYSEVRYSIWHEGKPVEFPGSLQNNTGLPFLWRVFILADAPEPTLLAGSQSLFLIYLKNGKAVVEPLYVQGSDFASLQFLDSENGHPGAFREVYMNSDIADLAKLDTLQGGRFLMVSEHLVLDVKTLKTWAFNTNNNAVDNYSFPSPDGALDFSPDRKSIVFHAEFQSWNTENANLPDSEHGIVVYDFEKDEGYVIPYDDTDTRMIDFSAVDRQWLETYFEWKKEANGTDHLHLRYLDKLPSWTGKYSESDNYYYLYPVQPTMLPVFLDFVLAQMGWTKANIVKDETGEYTGRRIELTGGAIKLDIGFQEDERKLTFSKHLYETDNPEYRTLVKKIADAFEAELAAGKHQAHFGRVINQTKRIHGVE